MLLRFVCSFFFVVFLLVQPCLARSIAVQKVSLCHANETVYFACQIRSKVVSLCGKKEGKKLALQYRFGKKKKVELQYPAVPATSGFRFQSKAMHARSSSMEVSFQNKQTKYTLSYHYFHGEENAGIDLLLPTGKKIRLDCKPHSVVVKNFFRLEKWLR